MGGGWGGEFAVVGVGACLLDCEDEEFAVTLGGSLGVGSCLLAGESVGFAVLAMGA